MCALRMPRKQLGEVEFAQNEPHFEEEWTVLSARQVVPLAELEAREKRQHSLKVVGAFFIASSLGALVALAAIRIRESNGRVPESTTSQATIGAISIESEAAPVEELTAQPNEESTIPPTEEPTDEVPAVLATRPARVNPRNHQTNNADLRDNADENTTAEVPLDSKPEPRLVDQWQEGRPRRVRERRTRNDDGAHHPRDLRDLDEIFEGSPKKP